jgi:hypothetical protein
MANINTELANGVLRQQHHLIRFEKTIDAAIQGNLTELSRELASQVGDADIEGALSRFQEERLTRLRGDANEVINKTYAANTRDLQLGLNQIATATQAGTVKTINTAFTYDITGITLNPHELKQLSRNPVVLGEKVTENWQKQNRNVKQAFVREMRLGIAQGETNQQLVNRVIGKPTGSRERVIIDGKARSVPQRTGGIMQVSKREATALVRTSAQTVSNRTLDAIYRDNADIIQGVAVLVTLDGRTTVICMSVSGGRWSLKTGDPLPGSANQIPYPGPPPYHYQCRTIISPITFSWSFLSGGKQKEILNKAKRPQSVRSSMNGEAPGKQNYSGFLKGQSKGFQNQVLGKARAELFRSGALKLNKLTDATLTPLNLQQLQKVIK